MTPNGTYRVVSVKGEVLWEKFNPTEKELREAAADPGGFTLWSPYEYCAPSGSVV
jgi:hypothetical protein